jgi:predicted SAM-dependent methyltransferase
VIREQLKRVPGLVPIVRSGRSARIVLVRKSEDARFARRRRDRFRQIDFYLRKHPNRKLQLGAGGNPYDGWLNTDVFEYRRRGDVVYLDAREPFPLPDSSFEVIFTEHMIEHLTYEEGLACLRECRRVLQPDGRIRVSTPALERQIALFDEQLSDLQQRYIAWVTDSFIENAPAFLPGFVVNNMFRNFEHRFIYDEQTLRLALETAGFVDVEQHRVGHSNDPRLDGLEARDTRSDAEFNEYETMAFEGRRP